MSIKEILKHFAEGGVDDLEIKKEDSLITIGYFNNYPVDCVEIKDNHITRIVFSRQKKLNWLFELLDKNIYINDDYFNR